MSRIRVRMPSGIAAFIPCVFLCGSFVFAQDPKPVVVARVTEAEVKSGQRFVGTVNPLRTSVIGSAIDGRVRDFLVNEGERVKKGQVLAQLRDETLKIEQAISKAELDLYVSRLAELENGSLPEEIAEAEANMRSAEAARKNAESKLQRTKLLVISSVATKEALDNAVEQADAAKFAFQATEALLKRITDGPRVEAIAQARAQVELQQQRLNLATDRVAKSAIVAPFDGFVSAEFTEVGAWISRGDPIAEVIQMAEVEIRAPVTAEAAVNLRRGDVIRVEFPELPNEILTGTIDRIVPVAESRSRTFPVHIKFKNEIRDGTPLLMAGMLVRVDLPVGKRESLPLVPKDSLVLNGSEQCVFVLDLKAKSKRGSSLGLEGKVRKVLVELGVAVDDRIQVRGDIKIGDLVVVVGNERLIPKADVKVVREVETTTP
jgi:HlyD family secretion protein